MILKKLFLSLACLIILTATGADIYLYQKKTELSEKLSSDDSVKTEPASPAVQDYADKSSAVTANDPDISEIKRIKSYLVSAEQELEMVNEQIAAVTEEISRHGSPEDTQKALKENAIRLAVDKDYAQLFGKLNLSPEDLAEFKRLEYELRTASRVTEPYMPETWKELTTLQREMKDKYKPEFITLLGKEKYKIYEYYRESIQERNGVNEYLAEIGPENKMSDDLAEKLISGMYEARMAVREDLDLLGENPPDSWGDIFDALILTLKKYEEAADNILPPDQAELFNSKRKWILEEYERTREFYVGVEEAEKK